MKAEEIAVAIAEAPLTMEEKLSWHLTQFRNSIPESIIPVLEEVVAHAVAGGDLDQEFELPEDVLYKGSNMSTAKTMIDNFHLKYYITKEN